MSINKFRRWRLLRVCSFLSVSAIVSLTIDETVQANSLYIAQTPSLPGANQPLPDNRRTPQLKPLPPLEDLLDSTPNQNPQPNTSDSEATFEVKQFDFQGNTVLEAEAVEAILKDYRNRPIAFADLLELETKLSKLYTSQGYISSGVVIPEQKIGSKGKVIIQAVEGQVEAINVEVNGRLKEGYIRSRLQRGVNTPFSINELQESLQLLQLDPLVDSLNAELEVGLSRDRRTLNVAVKQAPAFEPIIFANNYRTPSVGSFQRGIDLTHNNVLGYGDRASFIYKNTNGSNDFDAGYNIPVNSMNGTAGIRYRFVDSDIIEGDFEIADIESQTDELEFTFRQPILLQASSESTQELALGLEFSRQTNEVTVMNEPFPDLSPGADENGETKISAIRFFQDWTKRTRKDVLAARSQLSAGVDLFDATINEGDADGKFVAWRGQVQWLRQLQSSSNINLLVRSDIQLSTDDLVPLERFSLGGADSVRGYRQDALLGDSGIFASAEVRIPFYRWSNNQSNLSAIPFVDFGTSWSNSDELDTNEEEDTVASLGLGLQLNLTDILRARIDYGIPLVEVNDSNDTLQEQGIYMSLEYFPF